MAEQFFEIPRIGMGEENDSYRPKYTDRDGVDGHSIRLEFPDEEKYIALLEGDEETLRAISEEADVSPLTEAEVGRMLQDDAIGKGPTEGGPQPPEMGEGDTVEERVEDFTANAVGSSFVVMEGDDGVFSKPLNFRAIPVSMKDT